MSGFLIEYNRKTGRSKIREFKGSGGPRLALVQRLKLEKGRHDSNIEYVSLNSDSLETIKKTHSRYFMVMAEAPTA
ncbi:hypothetical protein HD598_000887 [Neomicrococcus aestuarii]|uniref:Uncharacterized protein n=1 Tax=Neomicrococcus aestuarii TaxID=556325 RepID=A0A7W8TU95_9MICC|nr:hypothetical protein [Neomicrococcus aestuarii]MBB5512200.1 hypothetical protein [Neomicrococcus aestuarii]